MINLNHKTFGQGDPIVILHGLFGTLDNWQTLGKQLAENHTVYLVDLRNHGRSPHHDDIDYPSMAEDLLYFLESNWMFKSHLIGHSMGGKVAMQFALLHPDMVDKLVVIDIAPKLYPPGHLEIFDALRHLDLKSLDGRSEADEFLKKGIPDHTVRHFLLKGLSRSKDGHYRWKMNLESLYRNYDNLLAPPEADEPYEGEALFIRGGNSPYVQDEDLGLIYDWFPNARVETVAGAGHWVHVDAGEELLGLIHSFIDS